MPGRRRSGRRASPPRAGRAARNRSSHPRLILGVNMQGLTRVTLRLAPGVGVAAVVEHALDRVVATREALARSEEKRMEVAPQAISSRNASSVSARLRVLNAP